MKNDHDINGALVICNHWSQFGLGMAFASGELNERYYKENFSTAFTLDIGMKWIEKKEDNKICHEIDMFALESLEKEDSAFVERIKEKVNEGKLEFVGASYGQSFAQIYGYESAIRQLSLGQKTFKKYFGKIEPTYLLEEQSFFTNLPQILMLTGYRYASLQNHNAGRPICPNESFVMWTGPDGTGIPAIPINDGMADISRLDDNYLHIMENTSRHETRMIFQWVEFWTPGSDWGATLAPYYAAIKWAEAHGLRQMTLTQYMEWALERNHPRETRIPMDQSNFTCNHCKSGWGYENDRIIKYSNICESLLLTLDSLSVLSDEYDDFDAGRKEELWKMLLRSQNHDCYLIAKDFAFLGGLRTHYSELALDVFFKIKSEIGDSIEALINEEAFHRELTLFNPCPWDVKIPLSVKLDRLTYQKGGIIASCDGSEYRLFDIFRDEDDKILSNPFVVELAAYATKTILFDLDPQEYEYGENQNLLLSIGEKADLTVAVPGFLGASFNLMGKWGQLPNFDYFSPNQCIENIQNEIHSAPMDAMLHFRENDVEVAKWTKNLLTIKDTSVPALKLQGMVTLAMAPYPCIDFKYRMESSVRINVEENGGMYFQLTLPSGDVRIFADSPFGEEERRNDSIYCSRYIRLEMPQGHLLWCVSQNTLFKRAEHNGKTIVRCLVLDFEFFGTANWGFRFFANERFSVAESMRLAESYHRIPRLIKQSKALRSFEGFSVNNENIFVVSAMKHDSGILLRTLNASDAGAEAKFDWPQSVSRIDLADLNNAVMSSPKIALHPDKSWMHKFRPWEIATFYIQNV